MGHINTETPGGLKVYFVLLDEKYSKVGFNFFRLVFFCRNVFGDSKD